MSTMRCAFAALMLSLGLAGHAAANDAWVVGTYAYPDRDRAAAVQPLADYLAARSGRAVVVRLWPSPSALVEALASGDADVIVPNLHAYLQGRERAVTLPVPDVPPAQAARYRSVIVARGVARLEDLLGRQPPTPNAGRPRRVQRLLNPRSRQMLCQPIKAGYR